MDLDAILNNIYNDLQKNFQYAIMLENNRLEKQRNIIGFTFKSKDTYIAEYKKYLYETYIPGLDKIDLLVRDFFSKEQRLESVFTRKDENTAKNLNDIFLTLKQLDTCIHEFRKLIENEYKSLSLYGLKTYIKSEDLIRKEIYSIISAINISKDANIKKIKKSRKGVLLGIVITLMLANSAFMTKCVINDENSTNQIYQLEQNLFSNVLKQEKDKQQYIIPEKKSQTIIKAEEQTTSDKERQFRILDKEAEIKNKFLADTATKIQQGESFSINTTNVYFDELVKTYFPKLDTKNISTIFFNSKVTAYTPFGPGLMKGTGKSAKGAGKGFTANGKKISMKDGATHDGIAIPRDVLPFGTKVYIPGVGLRVADDTGGALNNLWKKEKVFQADVRLGNYNDAIDFGNKQLHLAVLDQTPHRR